MGGLSTCYSLQVRIAGGIRTVTYSVREQDDCPFRGQ